MRETANLQMSGTGIDMNQKQNMSTNAIRALREVKAQDESSVLEFYFHFPYDSMTIENPDSISSETLKEVLRVVLDPHRLRHLDGGDT